MSNPYRSRVQVYVCESAGDATWREEIVVPRLNQAGISFDLAPTDDEWTQELGIISAWNHSVAQHLLVVIDDQSTEPAEMLDALEHVLLERNVWLVVQDVPKAARKNGRKIKKAERASLNDARDFLRRAVRRAQSRRSGPNQLELFDTVDTAIEALVGHLTEE